MRPILRASIALLAALIALPAFAETVVPPGVHSREPAVYPAGHKDVAMVALFVTLDVTGAITTVEVAQSGGADFDKAADIAVRKWKFTPATKDSVPFSAKIKIPFEFKPPPAPAPAPVPGAPAPLPAAPAAPSPAAPPEPPPPAVRTIIVQQPQSAAANEPAPPGNIREATVRTRRPDVNRGGSDITFETDAFESIASKSPEKIIELAPGVFIANEGGSGHADQVFLRGFDAETGSALEFTLNGMPLNQVNNPDGHGYADTHFIIPELVQNMRVIEGPFDPHQGDFAVAGSIDFQLGVKDRGFRVQDDYGSFSTNRILAMWAPTTERDGTFGAAEFTQSAGFGTNRASQSAVGTAEYEGTLGARGLWRILALAYAANYKSAGVVRLDDIQSGLINLFGTEDPSQGGNASRYSLSFDLQNPLEQGTLTEQVFLGYVADEIIEDFTGFLEDQPAFGKSNIPQRGDAIEQQYNAITFGSRGSYRLSHPFFGLEQAAELGYYVRYDHTTPEIDRLRFGTTTPYSEESNLTTDIVDIAAYADFDLHPFKWLSLRGGARQEFFSYNVLNNCATGADYKIGEPLDPSCPNYDGSQGGRLPTSRATAAGQITEPKVTALVQLPAEFSITGSYGIGAQSMDAQYISQGENAPFSVINAAEAGVLSHHRWTITDHHWRDVDFSARLVGFYTHVGQDLIFDPTLGRLSESTGTTRIGWVGVLRLSGRWYDEIASSTYAHATYDDTGDLVPYVPEWIARSETAVHGTVPWFQIDSHDVVCTAGFELSYVGVRALPFGQEASPTFVMDASASARWRWIKIGVRVDNLTDAQYPLSEFFYASYFQNSTKYPTLAPTESISAAPPRAITLTLALLLDQEANR